MNAIFKIITYLQVKLYAPVCFAGITALFFLPMFINREVFYAADNLLITIPARLVQVASIKNGVFPLWNPYLFSGTPFLADINLAVLYPSNLLYFVIDPFQALTADIVLHIYIAMLGTYAAIRMFRVSKLSSLTGGVIYGLSGAMITYTGNVPMIHVAALLPWVFWSWKRLIEKPRTQTIALTSMLWAFQIIAGHPQLTFYSSLFCVFYALVAIPSTFKKRLLIMLSVSLLTTLIALIQILPFIELALSSTRVNRGLEYATFGSLPPVALIRLFIPLVVGNLSAGTEWWQGGTLYGYIGCIPLILIILSYFGRTFTDRYLKTTLAASFLLSFGAISPLFYLAYVFIPGISLFRVPSHFLLITTFSAAVLTAQIIDRLVLQNRTVVFLKLAAVAMGLLGSILLIMPPERILTFTQPVSEVILARKEYLTAERLIELYRSWFWNIVFVSAGCAILTVSVKKNTTLRIFLFILIDVILISRIGLVTQPYTWINQQWRTVSAEAETLRRIVASDERLYVDPRLYPSLKERTFGKQTFADETEHQLKILRPNLSMIYAIPIIDGYASIITARYQSYFGTSATDPTGISLASLDQEELDSLSMSHLLTKPEYLAELNQSWQKRATFGDNVLLHNAESYPFARFISNDNPNNVVPAATLWQSVNSLTVTVLATESGKLIVGQQFYPGWNATDNFGNSLTIIPEDNLLQSVQLPPGNHTVTFRFAPFSLVAGIFGTVTGIIVAVGLLVVRIPRVVSDRKRLHKYIK